MGFWDWILGKESDGVASSSDSQSGRANATGASDQRAGAVAVLEPPDERSADAEVEVSEKWWAPQGEVFTELRALARPELTTEARGLENLLISHFDGHDLKLPPLVHATESVFPLLSDSNSDARLVAEALSGDQVIAAALLRMANSPLYRGLSKITALQPAVARLGSRALRTLLMHESLRSATFFQKGPAGELAKLIWFRSLASGCIMRALSEFTSVDREEAFLMGLLHDIGNVVVLRLAFGEQAARHYKVDLESFEYLCEECHQEFGELIADSWSLPSNLKAVICDHHTYPDPEQTLRTAQLQLRLTDMINALLEYSSYVPYDLLNSRPARDLGLIDRPDFIKLLIRLPEEVAETVNAL